MCKSPGPRGFCFLGNILINLRNRGSAVTITGSSRMKQSCSISEDKSKATSVVTGLALSAAHINTTTHYILRLL